MLTAILQTLFDRDLAKLQQEIQAYHHESTLWRLAPGISNSAGTLCLHLLGNLNAHLGADLAHTGYLRNRDREFADRDVPRANLLAGIAATRCVVRAALAPLSVTQLAALLPAVAGEQPVSVGYHLLHLSTHLAYHLGQINYHRRLLDED